MTVPFSIEAPRPFDTTSKLNDPPLLLEGKTYHHFTLNGGDFAGQAAQPLKITNARLNDVNLSRTRTVKPRLNDSILVRCAFTGAAWNHLLARRVVIEDSNLVEWQCIDGDLHNVVLRRCDLSGATFGGALFRNVLFEECTLRDVNFYRVTLADVAFRFCDVRGSNFTKAGFGIADFRTSQFEDITLTGNQFDGLILEPTQTVHFARAVGVTIADVDEVIELER